MDLSPAMWKLSRELDPGCEHIAGDIRTLRPGRGFGVVPLHDAVGFAARRTG